VSDEKPSGSSNEPRPATSVSAEAPAAATAPVAPVEPRCWCGAVRHATRVGWCASEHDLCWTCGKGPHRTKPNRCAGGHLQPGNTDAWKDGRHSERVDADTADIDAHLAMHSAAYRASIETEMWTPTVGIVRSLHRSVQDRPHLARNPKVVQQLLSMHQQARAISADLEAAAPEPDPEGVFHNAARMCALHPDQFEGFLRTVVGLQPALAAALRVVLAEHDARPQPEPAAVPVPQVPPDKPRARSDADDDDVVLL
jgi:beta-phosphoglucomutase-like phosphatase (HAD superfamily)